MQVTMGLRSKAWLILNSLILKVSKITVLSFLVQFSSTVFLVHSNILNYINHSTYRILQFKLKGGSGREERRKVGNSPPSTRSFIFFCCSNVPFKMIQ